ncbi:MAG: Dihydrolipoyllysine-residue acetyltransferase component of pyruvate dehydrogenase complex [bacterium ADurb.Bin429]|nr:MAG: Dihydrolipoyllysine-residue acetyltransferase component of pyruvate dehydrogenase complex [bacterium ADurb.Bin429]
MASPMRQAIARHMTFSKQNIPHYYLTMTAEMGAAMEARTAWNAAHPEEARVSVNDLIVKAAVLALEKHPRFNAFYQEDDVRPQAHINIGIAIALPDGLIAPAILDCGGLAIDEIGRRSRDLAARAKQKTLKADEYTAATFTITNLGMYNVDSFAAIIVPPQVGILAVGSVRETPTVTDGQVVIARQLSLTLSGDHRATDGAEGATFLGEIISCLRNPENLFA